MSKIKLEHLDKNKKYIIATDLDGTFLTHYNSGMLIENYRAVKAIKETGNYFVIATGRSWWSTKMIYEQLELNTPSIHFSGVYMHNRKIDANNNFFNNEIEIYLDKLDQNFVLDLVNKFDILPKTSELIIIGKKYAAFFQQTSNINDLFFDPYEIIIKMKPEYSSMEFVDKIKKFVEPKYQFRIWNNFSTSETIDLVISPNGTNKANGLEAIAKQLNIEQENVIFFGDNLNDLEALEWAGYSFAPSNAIIEAKNIADEVLELPNTEGAVAKKILDLIYE